MKIKNLLISLLLLLPLMASANTLSDKFPAEVLRRVLVDDCQPVPPYGDKYWQQLPASVRQGYIAEGEKLLGYQWPSLPVTRFADFQNNGDRKYYENFIFDKHAKLGYLVMAEVVEGKGRFINDIVNGLYSLCEEVWWGVPAHYATSVPKPEVQTLDLFNAETGALVAWTYHMLYEPLKAYSPLVVERIEQEIDRRILQPGLNENYWWNKQAMNWNPWICSNWLACVLLVEKDRETQLKHLKKIFGCLDVFIDGYPDDGGCDEGPSYWDRATGSLVDALWLLGKASNGAIDLSDNKKIKAMGSYLCKMNVGNGYTVNFADAGPKLLPNIYSAFCTGVYLNDKNLCSYGAYSATQKGFIENPMNCKGEFFTLGRELKLMSMYQKLKKQASTTTLLRDSYLPSVQVVTARERANSTSGLFFAAKGGHNGENHNHNDVGSFILYGDATPLIIDPGVGDYTRQTFSNDRYKIFTMRSGYHNLPIINGVEQMVGKQFASNDVKYDNTNAAVTFSIDVAKAYPQEANVERWDRKYTFRRGKSLTVDENYVLKGVTAPSYIVLMTPAKPAVGKGRIVLENATGKYAIDYNPSQLAPEVESVDLGDAKLTRDWGQLYRIKLKVLGNATKGHVAYTISKM